MCQVQRQISDEYLKPDHYDYIVMATATQEDDTGFNVIFHQ